MSKSSDRFILDGPMRFVPLTQEEIFEIDPTGRGRHHIAAMQPGRPTPMPVELRCMSRSGWLDWYLTRRSKLRLEQAYIDYDDAHISKYGPEGDSFAFTEVEEALATSYDLANRSNIQFRASIQARDVLMGIIKSRIEKYGYPLIVPVSRTTNAAGLPTMGHKGDFLAETVGYTNWRHPNPDLPGQRSMRLKHRVIHMTSAEDLRYIECELSACRNWLKQYVPEFFGAWRNPTTWEYPKITKFLNGSQGVSIETDFKACDDHTSWKLVSTLILPVYELLLNNEIEFIRLASFIEELFKQPVFTGTGLLVGLHNLFSGQVITNDFETIYDAILNIVGIIAGKLSLEKVVSLNMGDDIAMLISACNIDLGRKVMDSIVNEGTLNGHEFSLDKCALHIDRVHFCRRVHTRSLGSVYYNQLGEPYKMGAYPGVLTLNSIINPERAQESGTLNGMRAFLQRLDNTKGNPMASELVAGIVSRYNCNSKLVQWSDLEKATYTDWWERVYGTPWSHTESFAIELIKKLNLEHRLIAK